MSALLCSDYHIATMAKYVASLLNVSTGCGNSHGSIDAQVLANKLKKINIDSVNHRYNEKSRAVRCKMDKIMEIGANDFAALFSCWDYQACENPANIDYQIMRGFLQVYADKGDRAFSNIKWSI